MTELRNMKLADLQDNGACRPSRDAFKSLYGEDGNVVTQDRVMEGAMVFDWIFASRNLLTAKQEQHFKNLMVNAFRGLRRMNDPTQEKRKKAMAFAFFQAYNSPLE
jgi:hypothetical protein